MALATATAMVAPDAKGRATSVLLGGTTLACVAGVPAGALLGQLWGWRSAFWAVALMSLPAVLGILRSVPADGAGQSDDAGPGPGTRGELRALRSPRLVVTLLLGALVNGATFCAFTYLAPLVTDVTGVGAGWVPAVLAVFGLGSFVGVGLGGRLADTRPVPLLVGGGAALLLGWTVLALTAGNPVAAVVLVFVQEPCRSPSAPPSSHRCSMRRPGRRPWAAGSPRRRSTWARRSAPGAVAPRSRPGSVSARRCG